MNEACDELDEPAQSLQVMLALAQPATVQAWIDLIDQVDGVSYWDAAGVGLPEYHGEELHGAGAFGLADVYRLLARRHIEEQIQVAGWAGKRLEWLDGALFRNWYNGMTIEQVAADLVGEIACGPHTWRARVTVEEQTFGGHLLTIKLGEFSGTFREYIERG